MRYNSDDFGNFFIIGLFTLLILGFVIFIINSWVSTQRINNALANDIESCSISTERIIKVRSGTKTSRINFTTENGKTGRYTNDNLISSNVSFLVCDGDYRYLGPGSDYSVEALSRERK